MITSSSDFGHVYQALKQDTYISEEKSVHVFVANADVDSICAAQELSHIFTKDDIHYCMIPVESYQEVQERCETDFVDPEETRTVVMINCGATEDVKSLCNFHDKNVRVIVIDSHRPIWHGHNDDQDNSVVVLLDEDDPVRKAEIPVYVEDDVLSDEDLSDDADENGGRDQEHHYSSPRVKRRKTAHGARPEVIRVYYTSKAGYGKPSAMLMYDLAHALHYDNNFHVWLAILGLTDQLVHQRLDKGDYERWRETLEGHVVSQGNVIDNDQDVADGVMNSKGRAKMVINTCEELRLTVYRHWSLFESMAHTNHIATRMQTWRDKGMSNLRTLLANMAIKVEQHTAHYSSMSTDVKGRVKRALERHAARMCLSWEQLKLNTFELQYKNEIRASALDVVSSITALLGQPRTPELDAKHVFSEAVDALYLQRTEGIRLYKQGIERCKTVAQAIVRDGGLAITRNQVLGNRGVRFWYLDLANLDFINKGLFHHPSMLQNLAIFIRDAMIQRVGKPKGLVVVGPANSDNHCYVVAIRPKQSAGIMQNNPFAGPFTDVLRALHIEPVAANFDSSTFLIQKEHASSFIEELKAIVQAYDTDEAVP